MALRHQVFSGSAWALLGTAGQQTVNFILFAMLTRLLTPTDFGVMAIAVVVIDVLVLIGTMGQVQALVQRETMEDVLASTSFWMLQAFGLFMSAMVYLSAPFVAWAFDVPSLTNVLRVLAPVCMLQTLGAVPEALLTRGFGFKKLAARSVVASISGGIVSVVLAMNGFGVYAMVGQRLVIALLLVVLVWWASGWRPSWRWSAPEARSLARVGGDLTVVAFLQMANVRIIDVLVGLIFGPQVLGQLRIAWKIFDFVIAIAVQPVSSVALTALSRLQSNLAAMGAAAVRLIGVTGMTVYPIFFGIAVVANDVVPAIFGDKWGEAILFVQILSPIAVAATINYFLGSALTAAGRTRWILWQALGQLVLALILTAATVSFGVVPVLVSNVVRATIIAGLNVWLLKLAIGVTPGAIFRTLTPPLTAALLMTVTLVACRPLFLDLTAIALLRAATTAACGALIYMAALWFGFPAWRRQMVFDLGQLISRPAGKRS